MTKKTALAAIQLASPLEPTSSLDHAFELMIQAVEMGATLLCLPELFNLPYFPAIEDACEDWAAHAEESTGPALARMGRFATRHNVDLVVPFFERAGERLHNSAAVITANGEVIGVYRKTHLPHGMHAWEQSYFDFPREPQLPVFDTGSARVGVYICYERFFSEIPRALALAGAWILFNPAAASGSSARSWRSLAVSHAVTNGVYVCAVNRVGENVSGGRPFYGSSCIVDPTGAVIAEADNSSEAVLIAEVDREIVAETRASWPLLRGRRPGLYGRLVED